MGLRSELKGKRVYFDANIFIYLMEGFISKQENLAEIRDSIFNDESQIFTSELTLCEVLVPAFRHNTKLIAHYRQFIEESGAFNLISTSRNIYVRASLLRAQFGIKTPYAIHVASAIEANCSAILSNDKSLKLPKNMAALSI